MPMPPVRSADNAPTGDMHKLLKGKYRVPNDDSIDAKPRKCTDPCCALLFVATIAIMVGMVTYANKHGGDIRKLMHGISWDGQVCGVSGEVRARPLLYWCEQSSVGGTVKLTDGICVDACPSSTHTEHHCPGDVKTERVKDPPDADLDSTYSVKVSALREVSPRSDYVAMPFLGMYCLPSEDAALMDAIMKSPQLSGVTGQLIHAFKAVSDARKYLVVLAISMVVLGFTMLRLMMYTAKCIVWLCIALAWVALGILGVGGASLAWKPAYNPLNDYISTKEAQTTAGIVGLACIVLWVLFTILVSSARQSITTAINAIADASEEMQHLPTLAMSPFIQITIKSISFVLLVFGIGQILSMGEVTGSQQLVAGQASYGVQVMGMGRSIQLHTWQRWWLGCFIFGSVWIQETLIGLGHFALSHATVLWVFDNYKVSRCTPLLNGYANGIIFHLGTIAFGGFIVGVLCLISFVVAFVERQSKDKDGNVNKVGRCLLCCCLCCLEALEDFVKYVNELGYADCVIFGHGYPSSCLHVAKLLKSHTADFAITQTVTSIMRWVGTFAFGTLGTVLSYIFLLHISDGQNMENAVGGLPKLPNAMVANAEVLPATVVAGVLSFSIIAAFLSTFCDVADAAAYCEVVKLELDVDLPKPPSTSADRGFDYSQFH